MTERQKYASYNALARKPLIFGIPIQTLVIFMCLIMVTGFGGVMMFGAAKGLVAPLVLCFVLFAIKIKCENDSRAMEALWFDIKGALYRLRCGSKILSLTSTDNSPTRRKHNVREWFKNNRAG